MTTPIESLHTNDRTITITCTPQAGRPTPAIQIAHNLPDWFTALQVLGLCVQTAINEHQQELMAMSQRIVQNTPPHIYVPGDPRML